MVPHPLLKTILICWLHACSLTHGVSPHFAEAVIYVESRPAGTEMEIRLGELGGKVVGPMNIVKCYTKCANIYNPFINILIGVGALRGKDQVRVLCRYNKKFSWSYFREIKRIERKLNDQEKMKCQITVHLDSPLK